MITGLARFSYANVFEAKETPSGDMKFSVSILIPESDTATLAEVDRCIQAAIKTGLEKNVFNKLAVKTLRLPLRSGTQEHKDDARGPEYSGFNFLNANNKKQPGIVDRDGETELTNDNEFYSGCWGHADINFFPYNRNGNKGIGVGLNNLMKKKDDGRLDGRMKADQAFADYAEVGGDLDGDSSDPMI